MKALSLPTIYPKQFEQILQYPAMVVPSLSNTDIIIETVEAVTAYLGREMTLQTLLAITFRLAHFKGLRTHTLLEQKVNNMLFTFNELSHYLNDQKENEEEINDIIIKTLDELMKQLNNETII